MSQPSGSRSQSRVESREPSQEREDSGPQPELQREQSRQGRSRSRRSPSVASTISDSGSDEVPHHAKSKRRKNKKKGGNLPAVDQAEDTGKQVANAAEGVADKAGQVAGGGDDESSSDKPLKLRLDLNLDADIRLTAKVHGDITLSLLR